MRALQAVFCRASVSHDEEQCAGLPIRYLFRPIPCGIRTWTQERGPNSAGGLATGTTRQSARRPRGAASAQVGRKHSGNFDESITNGGRNR